MNSPRTLLEGALALAATGWAVLPLHTPVGGACDCRRPGCTSPGKHPRTKNGLTDATADADQIGSWWTMWPHANIGIAVPTGVVAVDVDGPEGVLALEAGGYSLPETATVETGRSVLISRGVICPRTTVRPIVKSTDSVNHGYPTLGVWAPHGA